MYQKPEPAIPEEYSGTALRKPPFHEESENCPPPPCGGGQEELLLLVLLLLVMGEREENDLPLALIIGALLLLGRERGGRFF
ncbi:MAG: hypothetical protein J6Z04_06320 [Clostridia bacterium]|nr:hypothetical protein [Clostridia bacterium]